MIDLANVPIVFVNNFPGPGLGGGEVQLLALVEGCLAAGMRVTVVAQCGSTLASEAVQRGAEVIEVDFSAKRLMKAAGEVRAIARQGTARVVQGTGFLTNLVVRLAGRGLHSAIVNVVHVAPGASLLDGGSQAELRARQLAERTTSARVDRYVAVSDAVADGFATHAAVAREEIAVIRNGIDAAAVRALAAEPLTATLPPGDGPLVGTVARLEPVKGVEDFVRAAALVAHRVPDARFAIAGAGSLESQLRTVAVAHGLGEDRLRFLGHVKPVQPLIAALDVLVSPSLSEGLPIAPLEAMALSRAVVATAVGGTPEVVENGITGLLAPASSPSALADAIVSLLADPARRSALGQAGRARVEMDFTFERMSREYLALYADLLGKMGYTAGEAATPEGGATA